MLAVRDARDARKICSMALHTALPVNASGRKRNARKLTKRKRYAIPLKMALTCTQFGRKKWKFKIRNINEK